MRRSTASVVSRLRGTGCAVICLLSAVCCLLSASEAAVPRTINYQGKLTEPDGTPIVGEHALTLRLYDAATGGKELWKEQHTIELQRDDNGVFSIVLGNEVPFGASMSFNDPLWFTIEVDGGGEFSPRQPLSAVGYAINADLLDGLDSTQLLAASGAGDITGVTAGTGLAGGGLSGDVTLTVNVGTTAGKIVQLDNSGALPAVSGANLTALNASNLATGTVPDARLSTNVSLLGTAIESGEVTDGTLTAADTAAAFLTAGSGVTVTQNAASWQIDAASAGGTITAVNAGAGLTGGGTSGSVTLDVGAGTGMIVTPDAISVDAGIGANQIVQLDGVGDLPAVSGANLTSLNASSLSSGTVADARLSANVSLLGGSIDSTEVMDGTLTAADTAATFLTAGSGVTITKGAASWDISATGAGGDITGVAAGTGLTGGGTTGDVTVALSTPVSVANGGTGATTLTGLLVGSGTSALTTIANNSANWDTAYADRLKWDGGNAGLNAATGRTSLGLGTIATQDASSVAITGGAITGITDLAVADGGTGASTAVAARANVGAAADGANSDITSLSGLTTPLSIGQGGTGATTAGGARANLINCMPIGGSEVTSRNATFSIATFGAGTTGTGPDSLWPVPVAGTINALRVRVAVAPSSGASWTVTVRQNGANSSLSCTIAGTNQACSTSGSVNLAAGDRVGVQFTEGGSAAGTQGSGWSACFIPD